MPPLKFADLETEGIQVDPDDRIVTVRQSWLGTYGDCPERARRGAARIDVDGPNDASAVGTAVHFAIEQAVNDLMVGKPASLGAMIEWFYEEWDVLVHEGERGIPLRWVKRSPAAAEAYGLDCVARFHESVYPHLSPMATEVGFGPLELPYKPDGWTVRIQGSIDYVDKKLGLVDWKGLALDTPLPTPTGWTTMGDVKMGDYVLGADGRPAMVVGKSQVQDRPCYKVTFDDGAQVVTDNVHLWEVQHGRADRMVTDVRSTPEIGLMLSQGKFVRVANTRPLQLPEQRLPIDPYVLGLWLGDGTTSKAEFTTADPETLDAFTAAGYEVVPRKGTDITYGINGGFYGDLKSNELLGNKHVPAQYLRGSVDQRIALLRGLMDTDGNWNIGRRQAGFDNTNFNLTDAVYELAMSLGFRATVYEGQPAIGKPYRRVTFTPHGINPFLLKRKAAQVRLAGTWGCTRRKIASVEPVKSVPTQCISVKSPGNLYLCGESMIPTHNTASRTYQAWEKRRWAIQPTVYLAAQSMSDEPWAFVPDKFTYVVFPDTKKESDRVQTITVTRTEKQVAWLARQVANIAIAADALGFDKPWPTRDQHALCSPTWCPSWDGCRGKYLGDEPTDWTAVPSPVFRPVVPVPLG